MVMRFPRGTAQKFDRKLCEYLVAKKMLMIQCESAISDGISSGGE